MHQFIVLSIHFHPFTTGPICPNIDFRTLFVAHAKCQHGLCLCNQFLIFPCPKSRLDHSLGGTYVGLQTVGFYSKYLFLVSYHTCVTLPGFSDWECSWWHQLLNSLDSALMMPRYGMDTARTQILHIKSEVSDTIRHDTLPILKYPCIIARYDQRLQPTTIQI